MNEREALSTMTDLELVAYWNILQFPFHNTETDTRHRGIVDALLAERGIAHEAGSLTRTAA